MTIEELLDEMESVVLDAARVPFTNKRVVEEDDMARILDELREVIPNEIIEAKRILADRNRILEEAQKEAHNFVEQAKNYVAKLTEENVITQQAQEQAEEIILQAQNNARNLQNDAISYANDVFKHLETNLQKTLDVIHSGHNELQRTECE